DMDSLTYKYYSGTNRLRRVNDLVSSGNYAVDIDDQSEQENYIYDGSGNLTEDKAEGLEIYWNAYGKVDSIFDTDDNSSIRFLYDPMGNRIGKRRRVGETVASTWYVRDAQGNPLATYTQPEAEKLRIGEFSIYGS